MPAATAGSEHYDGFFDTLLCNRSRGRHRGQVWNIDDDSSDESLEQGDVFWFLLSILIIAGNLTVIIWRCRARREQRNSVPSILVMNLAAADFFLGIQIFLFALLYSNWLCFTWVLPKNVTLMESLCVICAFFETTGIYASAIISATIAFYYAVVVFGRCCCIQQFSRGYVLIFLCMAWTIVVSLAIWTTVLTYDWFGPVYNVKTQEVYNTERQSNQPIPDNSTYAIIVTTKCLPLSYLSSEFLLMFHRESAFIGAEGIPFLVMCCLTVATAGTYLAIMIKLLRLRALSTLPPSLSSTSTGGLGFRLIAIAVVNLFGWTSYAVLLFLLPGLVFGQILPYGFVALSNPVTFTLLSKPFMRAVRKFRRKVLFKIGKPIRIEDMASENDSLIPPSRAPASTQELDS